MTDVSKGPPTLRPANENAYYCLATLHGENPDDETHHRNKQSWFKWLRTSKKNLRAIAKFPHTTGDKELVDSAPELAAMAKLLGERMGEQCELPDAGSIVDLSNTDFDPQVDFSQYLFPHGASFAGSAFRSMARFNKAEFNELANLDHCSFEDAVDFVEATFDEAIFERCEFRGDGGVNLWGAVFRSTTIFDEARFHGRALMGDAHFGEVQFVGTRFLGEVTFGRAQFNGSAVFSSSLFADPATFENAQFHRHALFDLARFRDEALFSKAMFMDQVSFSRALIDQSSVFRDTDFKSIASFVGTHFLSMVPDFRGATLHEATEWHDARWPTPPASRDDAWQQLYAYERLKLEMERLKKHEDEQFFFRKELRARRTTRTFGSYSWALNIVYGVVSGYGHGSLRPLFSLFLLWLAGAFLFENASVLNGSPMPPGQALGFSAANLLPLLPLKRELVAAAMAGAKDPDAVFSGLFHIIASAQSVVGLILLFLLGLALRNHFRMR